MNPLFLLIKDGPSSSRIFEFSRKTRPFMWPGAIYIIEVDEPSSLPKLVSQDDTTFCVNRILSLVNLYILQHDKELKMLEVFSGEIQERKNMMICMH